MNKRVRRSSWRSSLILIFCMIFMTCLTGCGENASDSNSSGGTTAPATPTDLTATIAAGPPPKATLTWSTSAGAASYRIYRDGTLISPTLAGSQATDTTVAAQTWYCYAISAVDASGNESAQSTPVCTSTGAATTDLSVSVAASTTSVSAGQTSIVTATVTGNNKAGAAVTFTLPVNASGASFINAGGSSVSSITLTAGGSGIATAIYQAGSTSSGIAVQDTVQAAVGTATSALTITRTGSAITAYAVSIGASTTSVTAGQVSIITATVTSTSGSTSTAAGGVTVTFTLPVNGSGATLSPATAVTDGSGKAVVIYRPGSNSPTLSVQDTVQAAFGTATSALAITRTGSSAYAVSIDASTTSVTAGQVSIITATVTSGSTPAGGVTVTFTLPVNGSGATLSSSTTVTDGAGKAVVTYQAGSNSPTIDVWDTVRAAVGTATGALAIKRTGTGITTYAVSIGASAITVTAEQVSIITATVTNTSGSTSTPASGVTVTFTVSGGSGATLSSSTAVTDGAGKAVVTYQAGSNSPTLTVYDTVKAAVGSVSSTVAITRTGTGVTSYTVTLAADPSLVLLVSTGDTVNSILTATVIDNSSKLSAV